MKRFTALLLCAALLCAILCGCDWSLSEPVETTGAPETDSGFPTLDAEREEDGSLILTSSENRMVYREVGGYIIVTFLGQSVNKIERIKEFESRDAATEYSSKIALDCANEGKVPPDMRVEGVFVITPVSFSSNPDDIGYYYTKTKAEVLAAFAEQGLETR